MLCYEEMSKEIDTKAILSEALDSDYQSLIVNLRLWEQIRMEMRK